jgi:GxxExxY protein
MLYHELTEKIVLELKSIESLSKIHEVQLVNYLKAVNKEVGILLNFGKERLEFKRKVLNL